MTIMRPAVLRTNFQRLVAHTSRRYASAHAVGPAKSTGSIIPNNLLRGWYNTFGKSMAMYSTWLVLMILVGEFATGKITDTLWLANNSGRTFTTYDWSKFDRFDEEGEKDEEEGDDEEDDE